MEETVRETQSDVTALATDRVIDAQSFRYPTANLNAGRILPGIEVILGRTGAYLSPRPSVKLCRGLWSNDRMILYKKLLFFLHSNKPLEYL